MTDILCGYQVMINIIVTASTNFKNEHSSGSFPIKPYNKDMKFFHIAIIYRYAFYIELPEDGSSIDLLLVMRMILLSSFLFFKIRHRSLINIQYVT